MTKEEFLQRLGKEYPNKMDEIRKLLNDEGIDEGFDEEVWNNAEISGNIIIEICRQYNEVAKNAKTMVNNNKDILKKLPFGIVCCITLGDEVIFQQIQGKANTVQKCLDNLSSSIKELSK